MRVLVAALAASFIALALPAAAVQPVPSTCTPDVNRGLAELITRGETRPVDNVLVCGTTFGPSRPQRRGARSGHQLLPLRIPMPDGGLDLVEVVTNDDLDGRVSAPRGAQVFAYGQYFHTSPRQRPFVAGIHDTHCATHAGADNGWVVVNGVPYPRGGCRR